MPETIKYVPQRRCIACMQSKPQSEMNRFVWDGEHLQIDIDKKHDGRGCYLCKDIKCQEIALKKNSFARAFRRAISKEELENIGRYLNAK